MLPRTKLIIFSVVFLLFCISTSCIGQETQKQNVKVKDEQNTPIISQQEDNEIAGIMFGQPVPMNNYYFAMRVALMFGTSWGAIPINEEGLEVRTWHDLLLSYEAFRRGIEVSQEELDDEITKTISEYKVDFNWKDDKEAYAKWVKDTLNESVELFENQMRHLTQLKKLYSEVFNSSNPEVSDEDARNEFIYEYNSLSVDLVQFDTLEEAQAFYDKSISDPEFFDKEKEIDKQKEKNNQKFRQPGFVSTEFLMHMWKFPKDAIDDMMKMPVGSICKPAPIYKGYGVFKILEVRPADLEEFPKRKQSYVDQMRHTKRYRAFYDWLYKLEADAHIVKYAKSPEGLFAASIDSGTAK